MPTIYLETFINAPIEVCFDLARSIDLHQHTTKNTNEKAVAGRTSGLIGLNETVTWQATHFGMRQTLTSKITAYERPSLFTDVMLEGVFKSLHHDHVFGQVGELTKMTDHFNYEVPGGFLGQLFDMLVLKHYLQQLLIHRNDEIKAIAETGTWKQFIQTM